MFCIKHHESNGKYIIISSIPFTFYFNRISVVSSNSIQVFQNIGKQIKN